MGLADCVPLKRHARSSDGSHTGTSPSSSSERGSGTGSATEPAHGSLEGDEFHDEDVEYPEPKGRPASLPRRPEPNTPATRPRSATTVLSGRLRKAVSEAAQQTYRSIIYEAERLTCEPIKLRHVRLAENTSDTSLYRYKTRRPAEPSSGAGAAPTPASGLSATRVLGVCQIHAPMGEIVDIIGHKSPLSFALLNAGIADYRILQTLVNDPDEYLAVKTMTMNEQWNEYLSRQRDFVVLEFQRAIETKDGRRGWVVGYNSVSWPTCPSPEVGVVRGSIYRTGIVVLESARGGDDHLDLFAVAEYGLKGQTPDRVNRLAARDRVFSSLMLITGTIEQRAAAELALLRSNEFIAIQHQLPTDGCKVCANKKRRAPNDRGLGPLPRQRPDVATYRCRKCFISVCGTHSSTWRRGKKEMRLCMECWAEATLQKF